MATELINTHPLKDAAPVTMPTALAKIAREVDIDKWPRVISGNAVWHGGQFLNDAEYVYTATSEDIAEVELAVANFKALELDGHEVSRETFHLPTLGRKLLAATTDLHAGRGIFVVRGLDADNYSLEDNVLIFLGISSYVGEKRGKQDHHGNMIIHVHHDKDAYPIQGQGITQLSNKASAFHTEFFCDLIGFQVRSTPASGGLFKASSAAQIYNVLRATRPDLVEVLAQPNWQFESRGKLFPSHRRAILFYHSGRIMFDFSQKPLINLTPEQREALEAIQTVAAQNEICYEPQLGDLSFVNNHAVLHARTAFVDDEAHSRHLIRLWLKNEQLAWNLPGPLQEGSRRIYENESLRELWGLKYVPKVPLPWNDVWGDASH